MKTYLFYDIETSGLNKAFDQVLTFAAIRCTLNLKEIKRHSIKVKLRPDVIPSPMAMLTNRISISDALSGTNELEAAIEIHSLLNEPGTISIGYNTLGFDDEFLRFTFHRNLLPPYTHQYQNSCMRMDLFPMTVIYSLYKKGVMHWPEIDGRPSLKLENLSKANSLAHGMAHDAMVDVEASVELARRLQAEPEMWDYLCGYFNKDTDSKRAGNLPLAFTSEKGDHSIGLMVNGKYGFQQAYQIPVLFLGFSSHYKNQSLWLRLDLPELRSCSLETIAESTWVVKKKFGEPGLIFPPLNRYMEFLTDERLALADENISRLKSSENLFQKIVEYHQDFKYPIIPDLDSDAALYQMGFLSSEDRKLCSEFHHGSIEEKLDLAGKFKDRDAGAIARRVIFRNFPQAMAGELHPEIASYLDRINPSEEKSALKDFAGRPRTTPVSVLAEIENLKKEQSFNEDDLIILGELNDYILDIFHI